MPALAFLIKSCLEGMAGGGEVERGEASAAEARAKPLQGKMKLGRSRDGYCQREKSAAQCSCHVDSLLASGQHWVFMGPHCGHHGEQVLGLQEGCGCCRNASGLLTLGLNS